MNDNFLEKLYKMFLGSLAKTMTFFGFVILTIAAFWIGIGYGFASCFGKSSCSPIAETAFVIFPALIIVGGIWLYTKWRRYKAGKYHQTVKAEVLQEMSMKNTSLSEQQRQTVFKLLSDYGSLTLDDLITKSTIPKDDLLMTTRQLMQEKAIKQVVSPGQSAYFTLHNPKDDITL